MRLWLAAPDWVFRALGIGFFTCFVLISAQKYLPADAGQGWWEHFLTLGPWCNIPGWGVVQMPWVTVLVDLTFLLILVSFLLRFQPRQRASNGWIVGFTLFTAFVPMVFALWLAPVLGWFSADWKTDYLGFLMRNPLTWKEALAGGLLITVGNALDVWGYLLLCRSFSIVPEARELVTRGPYRWVRHPVYLGQILAQAGVWLCFARLHVVWIGLYCVFVAMQLYRSKLEDRVLAAEFGEDYQAWRRRTFWFV
jgi:protein-S-isoprenylcysteine O-methyltransferase Ste14